MEREQYCSLTTERHGHDVWERTLRNLSVARGKLSACMMDEVTHTLGGGQRE